MCILTLSHSLHSPPLCACAARELCVCALYPLSLPLCAAQRRADLSEAVVSFSVSGAEAHSLIRVIQRLPASPAPLKQINGPALKLSRKTSGAPALLEPNAVKESAQALNDPLSPHSQHSSRRAVKPTRVAGSRKQPPRSTWPAPQPAPFDALDKPPSVSCREAHGQQSTQLAPSEFEAHGRPLSARTPRERTLFASPPQASPPGARSVLPFVMWDTPGGAARGHCSLWRPR